MERIDMPERPEWRTLADEVGFRFHSPGGETYWDETRAYRFSLQQIEHDIEDPSGELENMCLEVVDRAVRSEQLLQELRVFEPAWALIQSSWRNKEKNLYGRFDFSYDGNGPAKLLEYNADTPTSLYESAAFQWWWLDALKERGQLPANADQYNSIEDKLVVALQQFGIVGPLHLVHTRNSEEDRGTVVYLEELAKRAGLATNVFAIEDIGVDSQGRFTDLDDHVIRTLFKLYPLEWLVRDRYGEHLMNGKTRIIEPAWKMLLSNKGLLPLLWRFFPNHPNLLPAFFDHDEKGLASLGSSYVRKPLFSREGANIEVIEVGRSTLAVGGKYGSEGHVVQALHPLPKFGDEYAVIGAWMVASQPAGMGIREDNSLVTRNTSRFVPHFIA